LKEFIATHRFLEPYRVSTGKSVEIIDPPHETIDIIDLSSSSDDGNIVCAYIAKSARHQKLQLGSFAKTRTMASISCPSIKSGQIIVICDSLHIFVCSALDMSIWAILQCMKLLRSSVSYGSQG